MHTPKKHYTTPAWVVRTVASIVLVLDIVLVVVLLLGFATFGGVLASILIVAAVGSAYMSIMALKTANPAWVLLDLIFPM